MIKSQNILVTGERGYLASGLINRLEEYNTIIPYGFDVREYYVYHEVNPPTMILHFGSPSDVLEFQDSDKTSSTIIQGTINMIRLCRKSNTKIVFASTMGVYDSSMDNVYTTSKLAMENYIKSVYNNYIILRIPRVYSKCREKGLMRQIRDNTISVEDMDKEIEYITLQDFVDQTLPILIQTNITHEYKITHKKSIREIKQWIEK